MSHGKGGDPLREAFRSANRLEWRSRVHARVVWGLPIRPFVDVEGTNGIRWSLAETIGGLIWVRHDRLIEISGFLPPIGGRTR